MLTVVFKIPATVAISPVAVSLVNHYAALVMATSLPEAATSQSSASCLLELSPASHSAATNAPTPSLADLDCSDLVEPQRGSEDSDSEASDLELDWILNGSGDNDEPGAIEGYEALRVNAGPDALTNSDTRIPTNPDLETPYQCSSGAPLDSPQHPTLNNLPWHSSDTQWIPPSLGDASSALDNLKMLLHPPRNNGQGCKPSGLPSVLEKRLRWMEYFLRAYVNGTPWSAAALQTAQFVGKGTHMSRTVRQWSRAYILDRENLPRPQYGHGAGSTRSRIEDEDLKEELLTHLQSLGKYVTAKAVVDYIARPDIQRRYQLRKGISLRTAQNWMENCGFRWMTAKNGQYV